MGIKSPLKKKSQNKNKKSSSEGKKNHYQKEEAADYLKCQHKSQYQVAFQKAEVWLFDEYLHVNCEDEQKYGCVSTVKMM